MKNVKKYIIESPLGVACFKNEQENIIIEFSFDWQRHHQNSVAMVHIFGDSGALDAEGIFDIDESVIVEVNADVPEYTYEYMITLVKSSKLVVLNLVSKLPEEMLKHLSKDKTSKEYYY